MKKNYLLFFLLSFISGFAQFSKTHYIPPLSGSDNSSSSAQEQYLYISTPNTNPVNFLIKELGGSTISGTVSKNNPYVYNVGFGTSTQLHVPKSDVNTILSNKGYVIEAEDLIYVSARIIAGNANQSGALVSKGIAGLGTAFRIGSLLNTNANPYTDNHYTFVSVLATENNTLVQFEDIKPGVRLINNIAAGNTPAFITLNSGESFVMAVEGPWDANRDGLIGSVVISDKPIALNCGSFTGSNATQNLDLGFDQIVSAERTGKEYIFIKSSGQAIVERVLLIAHLPNTEIRLNGNTGAFDYLLANAGDYIALDGNDFSAQGNLYVNATENIFAYQTIGDDSRTDFANQEMFFVPPLNCATPHIIDNIPLINEIGFRTYPISRITIITETSSTLDFQVNGIPFSLATLASLPGVTILGPTTVTGNASYVTYSITGLTGNIAAFSSSQLYLAAYGTDGAATFGGFYSGFTFKPEISFDLLNTSLTNCIPNTELSVNTLSPFDVFQWYFNDLDILGANNSFYSPTIPGYYYVKATIAACGTTLISDKIPVSSCPTNIDIDLSNDNVDIDNDNDGITNCMESLGNQNVSLTDNPNLNIITTGTAIPSPTPFVGDTNGNFITQTGIGKNNTVSFKKVFSQPTSVLLEYVTAANPTDLLSSESEFIVNCDANKTITLVNPNNQLLVDTNYDGIYESGITKFSSFEIRYRLNSTTPLVAGTGTFQFRSYLTTSISFTHKNLSENFATNSTFKLVTTCVPIDTDNDGITDDLDIDSDNDGILDTVEAVGQNFINFSNTDLNNDGLDDAYGIGLIPIDTDSDLIFDYHDLDSDNDGVYDLIESNSLAIDSNFDGIIDGIQSTFGLNGLSNSIETFIDSGIVNYLITDTDGNGKNNYIELDSDNDSCFDTIEAGLLDANGDGILGNSLPVVNLNGLVTNAIGYSTLLNLNYITSAPISIITQPINVSTCIQQSITLSIATTVVDSYQWEALIGSVWTPITNNAFYSGSTTDTLLITNVPLSFNGTNYRVVLQKNGNSCGLISDIANLIVYDLPIIVTPVNLIQCDEDAISDGFTDINLRQKESFISANFVNETFTYYTSNAAALIGNNSISNPNFIVNPNQYFSGNSLVWVRVENVNSCFRIARINITVTATRIPSTFSRSFYKCDDFLDTNGLNNANNDDRDGIATFNFSNVTTAITALLPTTSTFSIKYYKNGNDAALETDINGNSLEISQNPSNPINTSNYRNIGYPNSQQIWIRVESNIDNSCFGLGPYINLIVESLPVIYPLNATNTIRACDDNQDGIFGFNTSSIDALLLNGQTNVTLSYFDQSGTALTSPLPNPFFVNTNRTIRVVATNNSILPLDGPCTESSSFQFIVDDLPEAFPVNTTLLSSCDDEIDPSNQDGKVLFDTSTFEATILNGQTGMNISYTDGLGNLLSNPLPNPFNSGTQNVVVKVSNPINPNCFATQVLPFVINPISQINLNEDGSDDELVCTNIQTFMVTLDAGLNAGVPITDYTYQWYLDGTILANEINSTITVNVGGTYSVDVTNIFGCFRTRTIIVSVSEIATIENIYITDLTDINTVEIITSGIGNYVYSLDFPDSFQPSNYFSNVLPGVHEVFVKDLNGCGIVGPIEIYVLGVPKFFTPNGDGFNDTWNIKGINENFNKNSLIYIFNRNGKLIKQISPIGLGWDGIYNEKPLPSDDYWYSITLEDGRIVKGHFSLKR